ncbi:hypothetical protein [Pedobacter hartonius]|nr:hypothetical protein [Pedobacter hartonius]
MGENKVKLLLSTGGLLVITIAMTLLVLTAGFFAGINVSKWQFPLSFLLTAVVYFYAGKSYYQTVSIYFQSLLSGIIVIAVSMIIAVNFYDVSYDGQSYHMEEIYQLKNGWNPTRELLPPSVNMALYINHYSKGVEIPQSALYSLTNRIETGKATNFILLAAAFCLTLSLLLNFSILSTSKSVLLSFLSVLNPVAVNQLFSTYVDGQIAILLLCFFVTAIWVIRDASYFNLLLLASIVIITANIKFTGLVYIVLFAVAFLAWLLFVNYNKVIFQKAFYAILISGFVAVFVVGYNPYVKNTISFHHPFYPLMGENKVDIMGHNLPSGFEGRNGVSKFFISLFAHTDNVMVGNQKQIELKVPFTFNKNDIVSSYAIDTRIAGFGALFSGIMLLSVLLLVLLLKKTGSQWKTMKSGIYALGIIILSVILLPESWWARYVPQLWYFPLIILLMTELYIKEKIKFLKILMYLCLLVNVSFTLLVFRYNFAMTRLIDTQMQQMKETGQTISVQWNSAEANRIRFQENQIRYTSRDLEKAPNTEKIICSEASFVMPSGPADLQKPTQK